MFDQGGLCSDSACALAGLAHFHGPRYQLDLKAFKTFDMRALWRERSILRARLRGKPPRSRKRLRKLCRQHDRIISSPGFDWRKAAQESAMKDICTIEDARFIQLYYPPIEGSL